jgi:uncharacterized repeat protein (TIGR03843 family)
VHQDERAAALNEHLALLANGEIEVKGRMPWSSNATFLAEVRCDDDTALAVYKPLRGERPLWDFPTGLYRREVAAWRLSTVLGWKLVPETVLRSDAPLGEGSLQRFVDADFEQHYFTLYEDPAHHDALRRICAFDLVANNADRKSGHCLLTPDGHIWGIDNGLCFGTHSHVRTVIWEFGGEPLPDGVTADLVRLLDLLPAGLEELLDDDEVEAVADRTADLLEAGVFPLADAYGRAYPWPLV